MTRHAQAERNIALRARSWFTVWQATPEQTMSTGMYVGADDEQAVEDFIGVALAAYTLVADDRQVGSVTTTEVVGPGTRHESRITMTVISASQRYPLSLTAVAEIAGNDVTLTLRNAGGIDVTYRGRIARSAGRSVITVPAATPRPTVPRSLPPWEQSGSLTA